MNRVHQPMKNTLSIFILEMDNRTTSQHKMIKVDQGVFEEVCC